MNRTLSQQEIDALFNKNPAGQPQDSPATKVAPFDFRRPDRIAKSQLRAIHQLHETFVHRPLEGLINRKLRFHGRIFEAGRKLGFMTEAAPRPNSPPAADMVH